MDANRPLRVFLCHSSADKPAVRELYQKLRAEPWIDPWLDEEELFPGDDWDFEIEKAIRETDVIIVCLSKSSITKEGYVQREIKTALDYSDEKPVGTTYIIPIRLEECKPPERLSKWQYADYFEVQRERAFLRLHVSLLKRAGSLNLIINNTLPNTAQPFLSVGPERKSAWFNSIEFMRVSAGKFSMGSKKYEKDSYEFEWDQHNVDIPYPYWVSRYPITSEMYNDYVKAMGFQHPVSNWEVKRKHPVVWV